jgi:signal peptidase II
LAGALGNILDSAFYGLIFDRGTTLNTDFQEYIPYDGIAAFSSQGYAKSMFGCVVDMFYFPMISGTFPDWFPIWGGEDFQFFRPIFNFADASISGGVFIIILFQKRFAKKEISIEETESAPEDLENKSVSDLNTNQP